MAVGTTAFPTALDTAVELVECANNAATALNGAIDDSVTTITVDSTALFPTSGLISIDSEIISYTGKTGTTFTGCTRGVDGSSAASHLDNADVEGLITSLHHEALRGAIIAVETKLGYGADTPAANEAFLGTGSGTSGWAAITNAYIDASAAIAVSKLAALTASRLPVLDASGFLSASAVTATEAGYLSGVTSAIQTQLDAKQASDADLTAIAALSPTNDDIIQRKSGAWTNRTMAQLATDLSLSNTNSGDVTLAGTPDYITISGQVITRNAVDLAADVTGNLPVANLNSGSGASGSTFWRGDGTWATPAGSGDVSGPGSSTDNAIVRWNLATGTSVQDSVVTIADTTGNMAGVGTLNTHTIPGGTDTFALLAASQTFTNKTLTAPDINGGTADALTSLGIRSTGSGAFDLTFANTEDLAAGRTLTLKVNDADRTIDIAGNLTLAAAFITSGANSLTLTTTGATNVTLPTSGTLAVVGNPLSQFAATTSAQLAGVISDETGSGALVFGTAPTFASTITVGTAGGTTGAIDLKGTTSGTVTVKVADAAGTYTLTLPTTDGGVGEFLQTDGSGVLSWASGGGGLTVGTTAIASGTAGRILYEDASNNLGEAAGLTYQTGASPTVTITAQNASYVGLRVNSAATPSANIAEFTVNGSGGLSINSAGNIRTPAGSASDPSIGFNSTTGFYQIAAGYIGLSGTANPNMFFYSATASEIGLGLTSSIRWSNSSGNAYTTVQTRIGQIGGSGVGLEINNGTTGQYAPLYLGQRDAGTTTVLDALLLHRQSSGTPAAGLGVGLLYKISSSTTANQDAARISALWTDATHASRTAKLQISLVGNAAALATVAEFDMDTTAGNTRMLIYDVDNATLERVSVGAADSGGAGFKVLCIPN